MRFAQQAARAQAFVALLKQRLVILDGAMGTMLQRHRLSEAEFRADRFADWPRDVRGNNDLLSITQPDIVAAIHRDYLLAGADITGAAATTAAPGRGIISCCPGDRTRGPL